MIGNYKITEEGQRFIIVIFCIAAIIITALTTTYCTDGSKQEFELEKMRIELEMERLKGSVGELNK